VGLVSQKRSGGVTSKQRPRLHKDRLLVFLRGRGTEVVCDS
jgi:hypothetical protein